MAKKKTVPRKRSIANSDIPLKDRLLVNKFASIAEHRDHAALTAMKIATVALNDTERMGYSRLARFAKRQQELKKMPTVDAVEVVRCKDCRHYVLDEFDGCYICLHICKYVKPNFGCVDGERKDNERKAD